MDTILIIEDDADLREGLEYTLSGEGYQILTAEMQKEDESYGRHLPAI